VMTSFFPRAVVRCGALIGQGGGGCGAREERDDGKQRISHRQRRRGSGNRRGWRVCVCLLVWEASPSCPVALHRGRRGGGSLDRAVHGEEAWRQTTMSCKAALVIACGRGGVSEVYHTMEFLDETRDGQYAH
jgi:hypothetical protein